jgi:hypothetical protein
MACTPVRGCQGKADLGHLRPRKQRKERVKETNRPAPGRAGKAGCASTCASAARAASARSAAACCFSACSSITRRKAACTRATARPRCGGRGSRSVVATWPRCCNAAAAAPAERRGAFSLGGAAAHYLRPLWALISCHLHERRLCVRARVELGLLRSATPAVPRASLARGRRSPSAGRAPRVAVLVGPRRAPAAPVGFRRALRSTAVCLLSSATSARRP